MDLFNQITPPRAYQLVMNQLEEAIISEKFAAGEKLPPERELIEVFGTSRRTLREAFRVLEQKGLIEIKVGAKGGTFVANRIQKRLSETLSLLVRKESVSHEDLARFRSETEGTAAALAAQCIGKDDLKRLRRCLSQIQTLLKKKTLDSQTFVKKEMAMHQTVADQCGNALYGPIIRTIHDVVLYGMFLEDPIDEAYIRRAVNDWKNLLKAMEERNPGKAKEIMSAHVMGFDALSVEVAKD